MSTAWVLNLDADLELASLGAYTPSAALVRTMRPHVEALRASLLESDDLLVDDATPAGSLRGAVGRAFCPTRRAVTLLRRAGASPEPHPPVEVLRDVNSRRFAGFLG
jgi:hypothetical protein